MVVQLTVACVCAFASLAFGQGWVALWLFSNVVLCVAIVGMFLEKENLKKRRWKQS